MRWAMGETSARSMRGAGMEDVIFAGTATRPARDFAEVSILLDERMDGETEIVRRIERGAGSAYRINGRDVRARDVSLLFADAATGAHSPAMVSQGRIGAVIAAKPAERRALLEEAAGIAGLHVRRKDAEAKLARDRSQSRAARRSGGRSGCARFRAPPAGAPGGTLPRAFRSDPHRRGANHLCALAGGSGRRRCRPDRSAGRRNASRRRCRGAARGGGSPAAGERDAGDGARRRACRA